MTAKRKSNRRTQKSQKQLESGIAAIKAFTATALIFGLSAVGLWRCLDDEGLNPSPKHKAEKHAARAASVDVGKGKTADPTLVNEKQLLEEEVPEETPAEQPPEAEETEPAEETASEEDAPVFPNYGVAFHFHTQMRGEPDADARVVAYARRGATFRLSERISTKGCSRGWYEVEPGGLFICSGEGVLVGNEPVSFAPSPPPANLDRPLPYRYKYVTRDNTPEYWRVPTAEEIDEVKTVFNRMAARDANASGDTAAKSSDDTPAGSETPAAEGTGAPATSAAPAAEPSTASTAGAPVSETDAGVVSPLELPAYVHLRMAKGYFVSTDDEIEADGLRYQRTIRGRLVPADKLAPASPSEFEGFLVRQQESLPRAFVVGGGVKLLRRESPDGPLKNHERIERYSLLDYLGPLKYKNRRYTQVGDGLFLPDRVVAVIETVTPPEDIGETERWIDVDLSEQTLVAYEGARPVFATLVSTGRDGFETPEGSFRIYSKHVTITMDDPDGGEEAYSIEDVPWVQYFKDSYAIHGAFWHNRFGRVRSHGCINVTPKDARRLFFWTGPHLPDGIHGASSTKENPGTRVIVHE